jgi:hypothetical protein
MMNAHFGMILAIALACPAVLGLAVGGKLLGADFPQTEISNGQLRVKLYLPDAKNGYYRGTRFDWSGVIASLEYKGHNFYGPWFDRIDPPVHDYAYIGAEVVAGACSGITGPVEEFHTHEAALGWDEAKAGGTFIKIGVGVLRKVGEKYDAYTLYEIVDPGKWTIKQHPDSVEFTQELTDPSSGYGYIYRKIVRLSQGKPEMVLEHSLKNTGRHTIQSTVYNHNFLVLDKQPPGPDFSISIPFRIHSTQPPDERFARIQENHIVFTKVLENEDVFEVSFKGFGATPKDYDIRIENRKVGAGMRIRGDRPLSFVNFWSMRKVLAMEPFIAMTIAPGSEFTWNIYYEYYTLPPTASPE